LAVEDAIQPHERTRIDRYHSHLFLAAYAARLNTESGELAMNELAAFITSRALITVRKDETMNIGAVVSYWDGSPDLATEGVGYLVHGLLDNIVDGYFTVVQSLDDEIERLEDLLFAESARELGTVQRRTFELRKSLVLFRRVVLPMREVVNTIMRRDLHIVTPPLQPYYQDVYDHALRAAEWTESLRDLVTTILETNLTVQSNRMNVITKKVTSWAAIIAVPTLVTGIYGMNVPYPGFGKMTGFEISFTLMVIAAVILYFVFKRKDWL
jgi:magnesium transporter